MEMCHRLVLYLKSLRKECFNCFILSPLSWEGLGGEEVLVQKKKNPDATSQSGFLTSLLRTRMLSATVKATKRLRNSAEKVHLSFLENLGMTFMALQVFVKVIKLLSTHILLCLLYFSRNIRTQ